MRRQPMGSGVPGGGRRGSGSGPPPERAVPFSHVPRARTRLLCSPAGGRIRDGSFPIPICYHRRTMPDPAGYLCLVLHGHLPYVLHHGSYPHGEAWLYEAAAETYLPLLDMIGEVALLEARPALTVGLTPVLLEQLAHPRFQEGFVAYLDERTERAEADAREFAAGGDLHGAYLARRWAEWHCQAQARFAELGRDLPGAFSARRSEGHIQLLTSNATHAYMPLLLNDAMLTAQMRAGVAASERRLGFRPAGMWLPECAYRPHWEHWLPSVLFDNPRDRPGLETFLAAAGVTHFFVDTHLITQGWPLGTL
ncbi:MAG: hypothetical protein FJX77_13600, partial [Armatimonadetes bacterium]|nr:hypothetical protein [Armatimonadota bacterium]